MRIPAAAVRSALEAEGERCAKTVADIDVSIGLEGVVEPDCPAAIDLPGHAGDDVGGDRRREEELRLPAAGEADVDAPVVVGRELDAPGAVSLEGVDRAGHDAALRGDRDDPHVDARAAAGDG